MSINFLPRGFQILLRAAFLLALFGLSACSTVLQTQVQRVHEWPAQMPDKSFSLRAIEDDPAQVMQLAQLKILLQAQLEKLGFVANDAQPHLQIQLRYAEQEYPVYQIEDVFFMPHSRFWARGPWRGAGFPYYYPSRFPYSSVSASMYAPLSTYFSRWHPYAGPHFYPGWWLQQPTATARMPHSFIYAPMWGAGPVYVYRESSFPGHARWLQVEIIRQHDQKKLFQVMVQHASQIDLASAIGSRILPFMLESGFAEFPGESGVAKRYSLKIE